MYGNSFVNPYMYQPYYQSANLVNGLRGINSANNLSRVAGIGSINNNLGGIKGLLGKFSFSGFLNGASKTLNVVNQAIPIFYQVKPMFNNAKTMFRIMGAVKEDNIYNNKNNQQTVSNQSTNNKQYIFYFKHNY